MKIGKYISDYFIEELKINKDSLVADRLLGLKTLVLWFLVANAISCLYAFYSLFDSIIISILGTILFQFIFIMIYIVLLSTVRKAEYLKSSANKKVSTILDLNGNKYPAFEFVLEGPGLLTKIPEVLKPRKSYSNIIIRTFLLILLGIGPAFFFGLMMHHPFTKSNYELAKDNFILKQIENNKKLTSEIHLAKKNELQSLIDQKQVIVTTIDSLKNHPDPNNYYLEDIAWYEKKLHLFEEINGPKIKRGIEMQMKDSIQNIQKENLLIEKYKAVNLFMLRGSVTWAKFPITFLITIVLFVLLLIMPFLVRYSWLISSPEYVDNALEDYYKKIIENDYENLKHKLKKSKVVSLINECLKDDSYSESQKALFKKILEYNLDPGLHYTEPAFKVNPVKDSRKFIEKGYLSKYIGK